MDEMKIIIRAYNPKKDAGIIYDTYPKGVYYGAYIPIVTPKDKWFKEFFIKMKDQLQRDTVLIACLGNNVDTILGYSIIDSDSLKFVYVKEAFRNQGIGTLLTKNKYSTIEEHHLTKVGYAILHKEGK